MFFVTGTSNYDYEFYSPGIMFLILYKEIKGHNVYDRILK